MSASLVTDARASSTIVCRKLDEVSYEPSNQVVAMHSDFFRFVGARELRRAARRGREILSGFCQHSGALLEVGRRRLHSSGVTNESSSRVCGARYIRSQSRANGI